MKAPPRGTLALAFTDVQGSTALWDRIPAVMRDALEIHDQVMRAAIAAAGGYEVKTEGDAFMVAFTTAEAGAKWCIDTQRRLLAAAWPERLLDQAEACVVEDGGGAVLHRGLRVRMGVHLGEPHCEPNPLTDRMDYFGPMVNRAARVSGAGHGGQVLLSNAVAEATTGMIEGTSRTDLGEHALKGLTAPERIWQLVPEELRERSFPPIRTELVSKTNLTQPTPVIVGRTSELAATVRLLDEWRAVTLFGPPGVGKTRLAREFAWDAVAEFSGDGSGAWLCDLSEATTPSDVCERVAAVIAPALVLRDEDAASQIGRALASKEKILLVLDNADASVAELAAMLPRWLAESPQLNVLITSRQRIGFPAEQCIDVSPLEPGAAIALFAQEASSVGALFSVDDLGVGDLVEQLDRLPLAIRLAAARSRLMSPKQIGERLGSGVVAKLSGLEAVLEASWNLLSPIEQRALAQCSMFHDGFTLEAVDAIFSTGAEDAVEVLQRLLDRSLIATRGTRGVGVRFQLLRSVREFAAGRLQKQPDCAATLASWSNYYADLGTALRAQVATRNGVDALGQLRVEQANLLAVAGTGWADPAVRVRAGLAAECQLATHGPVQLRRALVGQLVSFDGISPEQQLRCQILQIQLMRETGDLGQAETAIVLGDSLVATADGAFDKALLSQLECAAGATARTRGDIASAERRITRAVQLAREAADEHAECLALDARAALEQDRSNYGDAQEAMGRAVVLATQVGDIRSAARLRHNLGTILHDKGDPLGADRCYRAALELAGEVGDRRLQGIAKANLGNRCNDTGALDDGRALLLSALDLVREAGDLRFEGHVHMYLGINHLLSGDLSGARENLDLGAEYERRSGTRRFEGLCMGYLGVLSLLAKQPRPAHEQFRTAGSILREMGDSDMAAYFLAMQCIAGRRIGADASATANRARQLAASSLSGWLPPCVDSLLDFATGPTPPPRPDIAANQHISLAYRIIEFLTP